jgi:hypothetical protein
MQKKRLESGAVVESGMKQLQKVCGEERRRRRSDVAVLMWALAVAR